MQRAKTRQPLFGCYYERHHVKPRCLGGLDLNRNLVLLTAEEHYVAHQLLVKLYPNNRKIIWAALAMTRGAKGNRVSNKCYGWLRRKWSEVQTKNNTAKSIEARRKISAHAKLRTGSANPMFGKRHRQESCALISKNLTGKNTGSKPPRTPEHCTNLSASIKQGFVDGRKVNFKGDSHKPETIEVLRVKALELWERQKAAGFTVSKAMRNKQREALLKFWADRKARGLTGRLGSECA
jgi:hypothetical protein